MLLRVSEGYFERIWGGRELEAVYDKPLPEGQSIGEAWVVSDHSSFESEVLEGPGAGGTLHQLLEAEPRRLLGRRAQPTPDGRFPLLLKLLDARDVLSVQVHPNDRLARELGEPDVGKTEMWHVLAAEPDAELIVGLDPSVTPEGFEQAIHAGTVQQLMRSFPAPPGTSAFLAAGTVHAIGAGLLLAEIQQNSNITYRIYDWERTGTDGKPRALHIDKAKRVINFGSHHGGAAQSLSYETQGATRQVLAACNYFAGERVAVSGDTTRHTRGDSFHILLGVEGALTAKAGDTTAVFGPGQAVLVMGEAERHDVAGTGVYLEYYVPDLQQDIVAPLRAAGHTDADIVQLGGTPELSDLAAAV